MKILYWFFIVSALILSACLASAPGDDLPILDAPQGGGGSPGQSVPTNIPPIVINPNVPAGSAQPTFESDYTADQISPIFYGTSDSFILLGATAGADWLHPGQVYGLLYDDRTYDFYFNHQLIGSGLAHVKVEQNQTPAGTCEYYDVEQSLKGDGPPSFGFKQGQPVVLRTAEDIPTENAAYQQNVLEWLTLQGVPNPVVSITRILRVDIEGDGVEEILISASHFADQTAHTVVKGDYSVVIMRKVVGNEVQTIPLVSDIYQDDPAVLKYPQTHLLGNAFDLNGDGKFEVILDRTWWESKGVSVYEMDGSDANEVLKVNCGMVAQN